MTQSKRDSCVLACEQTSENVLQESSDSGRWLNVSDLEFPGKSMGQESRVL